MPVCLPFARLIVFCRGEVFIGIQFCWDGADMFNHSGKVIWPLSISILNFPKDLRDKLNIGLHVVAMCSGNLLLIIRYKCIIIVFLMYFQCISNVFTMYLCKTCIMNVFSM